MYSILSSFKKIFSKKYLCKAPFNNIYIGGDGSITPCCFNRTDILGNIYDTPLKDILLSPKSLELRALIKNGIFPTGCKFCKNQVEKKNKANSGIVTYEKFPFQENYPSVIEFELSYACNLRCTMCQLNEDHLFVNPVKIGTNKYSIISQISPYLDKVKLMRFYGGEPFFIEEYYSIWEKVVDINPTCHFIIQTNGTIYNQRVKEITSKGIFNFNMSLDSLDKKTYEAIRIKADFEKSMSNLFSFRDIARYNNQIMSISVCPMRINWKEIPFIVKFCNKNKFHIFFNTVVNPWHLSLWSLSKYELSNILNYYSSFHFYSVSLVSLSNIYRWKSFLNLVAYWKNQSQKRHYPTESETESCKVQVLELLKNKLTNISEDDIKYKVDEVLTDLIHFLPSSVIIDKFEKADSKTIYENFWLRKNQVILENYININYHE
jgi:MoaA/NifB/PqqE/SkfB family radical SAM enzyme